MSFHLIIMYKKIDNLRTLILDKKKQTYSATGTLGVTTIFLSSDGCSGECSSEDVLISRTAAKKNVD